ncbi:uncharacterized protein E0L32_003024 [Thyridium curvatum]|uniref:HhH-GPD domain-containing protein n=1 Tax=Thyridium curvatum TaxID=1093900 RepID=A0A507BJY5_9PEZI|nr:uncharacterized protein E0L32_003024 [Thyridium curvatum]TPX17381.1 hypothetical protein E0L32_003024 [Thyridium curvatum]
MGRQAKRSKTSHVATRTEQQTRSSMDAARDLLYGFEVPTKSQDFIASLIASENVPRDELDVLRRVSLMAGAEDWDLRMACATALRDRVLGPESGSMGLYLCLQNMALGEEEFRLSIPFVEREDPQPVKNEDGKGAGSGREKQLDKGKSPFWTGDLGTDSIRKPRTKTSPGITPRSSVHVQQPVNGGDSFHQLSPVKPLGDVPVNVRNRGPPKDVRSSLQTPAADEAVKEFELVSGNASPNKRSGPAVVTSKKSAKSPYFTPPATEEKSTENFSLGLNADGSPRKSTRPPRGTVSSLPFPTLSAPCFGLVQERLAGDAFRLLIAVTFLIRTSGKASIPVFEKVMERWPSPEALANADRAEFVGMTEHLGLAAVRYTAIQKYARIWCEQPPTKGRRYAVKNYPHPVDGKDVRAGEEFGAEDAGPSDGVNPTRGKDCLWEIGHLTQGKYAIDSWRIFCRDALLGRASDWKGGGREPGFQPEWMRVLPDDKELRACLRWMWMREGWEWDPVTGEREVLRKEMRQAVDEGRVAFDNSGQLQIVA